MNPADARLCAAIASAVVMGGSLSTSASADEEPRRGHRCYVVNVDHVRGSPEDVERVVTIPIEHRLAALPGISGIRSNSWEGRSQIFVDAVPAKDDEARDRVLFDTVLSVTRGLPPETTMSVTAVAECGNPR